jgi:FtsZ-binding cell division protein ZapB
VNRLTEDNKFLRQEVKEVKELNAKLMDNVDVLRKRIEVIDKENTENQIEMNDNNLPAQRSQILFSNLLKLDSTNKIPDPIHNIINIGSGVFAHRNYYFAHRKLI